MIFRGRRFKRVIQFLCYTILPLISLGCISLHLLVMYGHVELVIDEKNKFLGTPSADSFTRTIEEINNEKNTKSPRLTLSSDLNKNIAKNNDETNDENNDKNNDENSTTYIA